MVKTSGCGPVNRGSTPRPPFAALAVRVADGAVALLEHDSSCREFACLQRDGCTERAALMAAHNDAVNEYAEAKP